MKIIFNLVVTFVAVLAKLVFIVFVLPLRFLGID
jgi:hypothetical protein